MASLTYFALALGGLLIICYVLQGAEAANCRSGWLQYEQYCYGVIPSKMSWAEAEAECQYLGRSGHLASFETELQLNVVAKHIIATYSNVEDVWIGLEDNRKTRTFSWTDGSPFRFASWRNGEPNNLGGNEYCIHMDITTGFLQWNDANCNTEKSALCKIYLR